ncbi:hypothetical protein A3Q56_07263 [Intoshia linei]|uniref:Uncharacterized protein n=1 Tax=Intoshia linei TaxID=1819745 RepID=A0A177AUE7_9BILA|nr:hypothetical protein A3Q56_07263 [Intoshia linei]
MTKPTLEKSGNLFAMSKNKKISSFESSRKSVKMESKSS